LRVCPAYILVSILLWHVHQLPLSGPWLSKHREGADATMPDSTLAAPRQATNGPGDLAPAHAQHTPQEWQSPGNQRHVAWRSWQSQGMRPELAQGPHAARPGEQAR